MTSPSRLLIKSRGRCRRRRASEARAGDAPRRSCLLARARLRSTEARLLPAASTSCAPGCCPSAPPEDVHLARRGQRIPPRSAGPGAGGAAGSPEPAEGPLRESGGAGARTGGAAGVGVGARGGLGAWRHQAGVRRRILLAAAATGQRRVLVLVLVVAADAGPAHRHQAGAGGLGARHEPGAPRRRGRRRRRRRRVAALQGPPEEGPLQGLLRPQARPHRLHERPGLLSRRGGRRATPSGGL